MLRLLLALLAVPLLAATLVVASSEANAGEWFSHSATDPGLEADLLVQAAVGWSDPSRPAPAITVVCQKEKGDTSIGFMWGQSIMGDTRTWIPFQYQLDGGRKETAYFWKENEHPLAPTFLPSLRRSEKGIEFFKKVLEHSSISVHTFSASSHPIVARFDISDIHSEMSQFDAFCGLRPVDMVAEDPFTPLYPKWIFSDGSDPDTLVYSSPGAPPGGGTASKRAWAWDTWSDAPGLLFSCFRSKENIPATLIMVFHSLDVDVEENTTTIRYRVDDGRLEVASPTLVHKKGQSIEGRPTVLGFPPPSISPEAEIFYKRVLDGNSLYIQFRNSLGEPTTAQFRLGGLRSELRKVERGCGENFGL